MTDFSATEDSLGSAVFSSQETTAETFTTTASYGTAADIGAESFSFTRVDASGSVTGAYAETAVPVVYATGSVTGAFVQTGITQVFSSYVAVPSTVNTILTNLAAFGPIPSFLQSSMPIPFSTSGPIPCFINYLSSQIRNVYKMRGWRTVQLDYEYWLARNNPSTTNPSGQPIINIVIDSKIEDSGS